MVNVLKRNSWVKHKLFILFNLCVVSIRTRGKLMTKKKKLQENSKRKLIALE